MSDLPAELAEFVGVYQLLRDVSSGGEPVFGRRCNDASRHRNDCERPPPRRGPRLQHCAVPRMALALLYLPV